MAVDYIETQIPVAELKRGMHVVRLDRPWLETNFLVQGFVVRTQAEIQSLRDQCEYVFVASTTRRKSVHPKLASVASQSSPAHVTSMERARGKPEVAPPQKEVRQRVRYINQISVEQELRAAKGAFREARSLAKNIMEGLRLGVILELNQAKKVVSACVESVLRNQDALLWLTHMKHEDEYTAEHSMNVCVLSAAFAKHLGLTEQEIEQVALCGLLHDVGKTRVPLEILNKRGALTQDELAIMQMHPVYGREILMSSVGDHHVVVQAAYSHHERVSGGGYPRGIHGDEIHFFSKIVSLADTYDAITSGRCYAKGRSSKEALDILYKYRGEQFDEELTLEFIQCIGIYPPGALVEMQSGEVGIVVASDDHNKLRPRISILLDKNKNPQQEHVIDLMQYELDSSNRPHAIKCELPDGSFGIRLQECLDKGLVLQLPHRRKSYLFRTKKK